MTDAFSLPSSTGRESVTWRIRGRGEGAVGTVLTCEVTLAGSYYDGVLASGEQAPDFCLALRGLKLWARDLERLVERIETWLVESSQAARPIALSCSMGGLFDQSLLFELGPRDDTLSGGRPVASFRYITGRMTGEMVFPTDPSCLRGFVEGIRESALGA